MLPTGQDNGPIAQCELFYKWSPKNRTGTGWPRLTWKWLIKRNWWLCVTRLVKPVDNLVWMFVLSGPTLRLDIRVSHAALSERYHFNKQTSLDRDGRQCMSTGITYSYCRLRPVVRDVDQFIQVAMGMKQWDCVSFSHSSSRLFWPADFFSVTMFMWASGDDVQWLQTDIRLTASFSGQPG